jgi:hypothetical protein
METMTENTEYEEKENTAPEAKEEVAEGPPETGKAQPPRICVLVAGRYCYVEQKDAVTFMAIEALTGHMDREQIRDFSARYRLRIEVFAQPTGDARWLVCENGTVNW